MAHKGNPYPVLLRRDWNLNVSVNWVGFPRRYILHFGHAGFLTNTFWDMGPDVLSAPRIMTWQSAPREKGPFVWQTEFNAQINADGQTYRKFFRVFDFNTAAVVLQWRVEQSERAPGLSPWVPFLESENPIYFPQGVSLGEITCNPKLWTDGPPN